MIEAVGGFLLVHVATPLEVCEKRDRRVSTPRRALGWCRTSPGISDPYEAPTNAAVVIDTTSIPPEARHRRSCSNSNARAGSAAGSAAEAPPASSPAK